MNYLTLADHRVQVARCRPGRPAPGLSAVPASYAR
jgi:hypothetical protein